MSMPTIAAAVIPAIASTKVVISSLDMDDRHSPVAYPSNVVNITYSVLYTQGSYSVIVSFHEC
jgi:hypothetical protein